MENIWILWNKKKREQKRKNNQIRQLMNRNEKKCNNTFLTKGVNTNNWTNQFIQRTWFGTLFSMGTFTIHLEKNTLFWVEAVSNLAYKMCVFLHCSKSQRKNTGTWYSDTVVVLSDFQTTGHRHDTTKSGLLLQLHRDIFFWEFQTTGCCYQQKYLK